ncbi:protein of unknown function [Candidatus Nitrospira inopinata]|jgi:hypothetical protein|uniref:Uncharacterized protein n=1 Tax=Candidatus Nitrospira inopinata TaxID=1715989 RepID=A0A0S4KVP0_9BACT|nr:protein of unknown function [Candidatus Nitrospira inopinata]
MRFRLSSKLPQLHSHIFGNKTDLSASARCGVCFCATYAVRLLEDGMKSIIYDEPLKNSQFVGCTCVDRSQVVLCLV